MEGHMEFCRLQQAPDLCLDCDLSMNFRVGFQPLLASATGQSLVSNMCQPGAGAADLERGTFSPHRAVDQIWLKQLKAVMLKCVSTLAQVQLIWNAVPSLHTELACRRLAMGSMHEPWTILTGPYPPSPPSPTFTWPGLNLDSTWAIMR